MWTLYMHGWSWEDMFSHWGFAIQVEYQVHKRSDVSSTSLTNSWMEPSSVSSVPYLQSEDIDFTSNEKK